MGGDARVFCLCSHLLSGQEGMWVGGGNNTQTWDAECFGSEQFSDVLWSAVDEVIGLCDCDVYCYSGDMEGDPFGAC